MRDVLIVSPHFPPTSAVDMHRVRQSLPHLAEFGWRPSVLAVAPEFVEFGNDPLLLRTIPANLDVVRVPALPSRLTRTVGLGDIALRSLPFLLGAGARMLHSGGFSLVYFSTTAFATLTLGRIWKAIYGVPFVVDMQDPWSSDYYRDKPARDRPPKYWFSRRLHATLEPWTMKAVDGLISVSPDYLTTLNRRYPWLASKPQTVLPFGASEADIDVVRAAPLPNTFFRSGSQCLNGVYVGRGGKDMERALRIIFAAFKRGLQDRPDLFGRVRLYFVGTDYATGPRATHTVTPVAESIGVASFVQETPERVPYFEALQLLQDADFLIVPGSDDPQYTASKIFPFILARKPLLAVFHRQSSVCRILEDTHAGTVVSFDIDGSSEESIDSLTVSWSDILSRLPFVPTVNWDKFTPFSSYEMTRAQCALFEKVVASCSR